MCANLYYYVGVVDITYGSGPHVVAMAASGELYSWGHDSYGQLGLGVVINTSQGTVPRLITGELEGVRVTQVACGGHHTLALTAQGQVSEIIMLLFFLMETYS